LDRNAIKSGALPACEARRNEVNYICDKSAFIEKLYAVTETGGYTELNE